MPLPRYSSTSPQAQKGEDIKKEVEVFAAKVRNYRNDFRRRPFFKYSTGFEQAYPELDKTAHELADLKRECGRLVELASVFEFPQLVEPVSAAIRETVEDLVMVKDVWDTAVLCEVQFQVSCCVCRCLAVVLG